MFKSFQLFNNEIFEHVFNTLFNIHIFLMNISIMNMSYRSKIFPQVFRGPGCVNEASSRYQRKICSSLSFHLVFRFHHLLVKKKKPSSREQILQISEKKLIAKSCNNFDTFSQICKIFRNPQNFTEFYKNFIRICRF